MGIGDFVGLSHVLAAAAVAATVSACDLEPCESLNLSATHTRGLDDNGPTVIALSDGGQVKIVRACTTLGSCSAELAVHTYNLVAAPDQLMLTASGRWLTYRVGSEAKNIDLEAPVGSDHMGVPGEVDELIGSLRSGDWLVYRTWGETESTHVNDSDLWAVYVRDPDEIANSELDTPTHFRIGTGPGLRVVAMGHRHIVARKILGDGLEELFLVRIAPARQLDDVGAADVGDPLLLARGQAFRRVVITEGPSPAERGDNDELWRDVPTDTQIIATSGAGQSARTLIYSVADTRQIANFEGEVVTSLEDLEDVPGLSPVSPDGTHLAYITPRGSLALRDLQDQSSCLIRPAAASRHLLAGFADDGTVYFESREDSSGDELVYAYDALTKAVSTITKASSDDPEMWRLQAVPPQRYVSDEPGAKPIPWAVVGSNGDWTARPGQAPRSLSYDEASYLPRGDESLWVLEAEPQKYDGESRINLRRIQPELVDGGLDFDTKDADPSVSDANGQLLERFSHAYTGTTTVCVSASQSASRTTPWATQCSEPEEPKDILENGLPEGEQGL